MVRVFVAFVGIFIINTNTIVCQMKCIFDETNGKSDLMHSNDAVFFLSLRFVLISYRVCFTFCWTGIFETSFSFLWCDFEQNNLILTNFLCFLKPKRNERQYMKCDSSNYSTMYWKSEKRRKSNFPSFFGFILSAAFAIQIKEASNTRGIKYKKNQIHSI